MLWKLLGGQHEEAGKRYKKGDTISTPRDLGRMFKFKFERLPDQLSVKLQEAIKEEMAAEEVSVEDNDVTDQFPAAEDVVGLKVLRMTSGKSLKYNVLKDGVVLNDKLLSKGQVSVFIEDLAGG